MIVEAVSHALAASAFEEAAHLTEQHTWTYVPGNQKRALHEQLQSLSETLIMAYPSLRPLYALALMNAHHWEADSAHLQTIEQGYLREQEHLSLVRGRIAAERISPTASGLTEHLFLFELLPTQA